MIVVCDYCHEKVDVNLENKSAIIECVQEVNESKIKEVIEKIL